MNNLTDLLVRYGVLLLFGLGFGIFYFVFTPLTVYPVFFILNNTLGAIFFPPDLIVVGDISFSIVEACIAGAAYYLLLILNLSTPMRIDKRVLSLVFLLGTFLVLNIVRIVIFANLFLKGYQYFSLAHEASWYFGSTFLIVLLWFSNILIFKVRDIPVYTDLRRLGKEIRR